MGEEKTTFPKDSKLSLREIRKSFPMDGSPLGVLLDISLFALPGEFISILGPSGCGKSTLFNIVAGLVQLDSGTIAIENRHVENGLGEVAYMQQKDLLFPWRTILQNVLLGPEIAEGIHNVVRSEAMDLMARVGLRGFEGNYPDASVMQRILLDLWTDYRKTILLVTHDVEEALLLSDRIYVLTARPATVKGEINMDIARPRRVTDSSFVHLKGILLEMLQGEIERVFA